MDEFECADTDENSGVKAIDDHTLHVRVSLTNTSNSFKSGTELSSLTDESSVIRYGNYRSNSNFSEDESAQHQRTNSFKSFGKIEKGGFSNTMMDVKSFQTPKKIQGPGIPKSNSSHTYKFFAKKFEENFNREVEKLNVFAEISKEILVKILHALRFLAEPSETNEANDLFGLLEKCSTQSYLKSLLQTILKIKSENSLLSPMEAAEVKDRFPLMYSNFFKAKRKSYTVEQPSFSPNTTPRSSFTYQIVKKHLKSTEKYKTQAEQLRAYELTLEAKFERSIEKVNKEKYKECTFKPKINKKSKLLDSSPKVLRTNNTSPYLNLKDCKPSTNRTDILYEFAEVSRKLKENYIEEKQQEELGKMSFSPVIKNFKSKENTPVKGMDEVVKRMQKARGEKEWTKNMLERGVVIKVKDKENCKMVFDRLAEVEVSLPNGGTGKIAYCKGENLGGVVKDFCLKHNLPLAYHEKVMKKVVKSVKSREY